MSKNTDNFGNVIPAGWELDPVWGNICGAIRPIGGFSMLDNPNANLDPQDPLRDMIQISPEETA